MINIFPDSLEENLSNKFEYGVFYVPKTTEAQADFLNNGDHLNSIRLHILEIALNNSTNLSETITYLDNVSSIIQDISNKADKVIFILEKMPAWLSSSSDGTPAQTPGWFVLNTKPPANYSDWSNMVQQVTDRIINTYGISNAYFEIWNEPDLGSWTGTQAEYFTLFKESYDAIKSVNNSIPVGGPATNHWANNIYYTAPFGYISSTQGELSLVADLIDSTIVWNKPLDFVSWHNFNLSVETHQNAIDFIENKYNTLGVQTPELIISEWNAPSAVRDSDLHYAFATKNTIAIKRTTVSNDVIAAWQDFAYSVNEFHGDYGLLTYGSIRKPFFNAVSLSSELKGIRVKSESSVPLSYEASVNNDSLIILVSNYTPPPIIEAFNKTLFDGQLTVNQLDSAGYIDINSNDLSVLESIYNSTNTIPNSSALNQAINNSISTYEYFDSIQNILHDVEISISGYNGNYSGEAYTIDDNINNDQFTYDSLLNNGFNQSTAIAQIQGNQQITAQPITFNSGNYQMVMKPNSVTLLKLGIADIVGINFTEQNHDQLKVYPNPTNNIINLENQYERIGIIKLFDAEGKLISAYEIDSNVTAINLEMLDSGIYFIHSNKGEVLKIVKN